MRAASLLPHRTTAAVPVHAGLRVVRAARSWRALVTLVLVAASCAYVVPVERSIGLFTSARPNASALSSGELLPPAALLANATAAGTVTLNWSPSPSAITTGYAVYRIADLETDFSLIGVRTGIGSTSYVDAGLPPSTPVTYRIVSLREDWTSAPSIAAGAVTWP